MPQTEVAANPVPHSPPVDIRVAHSTPDLWRFAILAVQMALLLVTFKVYALEQPAFFSLACIVFAGATASYWLPFRFKQTFLILLSFGGAWVLLGAVVAGLLAGIGLAMFAIVRSPLAFRWKVLLLFGILGIASYGRATTRLDLPREFWPVLGSLFIFRMIVYMYDLSHTTTPPGLKDYLSYFFLLPNYYFLLFPVMDLKTYRKSFFQRDIHVIAQKGMWWILRGTTHLLLYRLIYQEQGAFSPAKVGVLAAVIVRMMFSYMLILKVSGQFHIIAGMLCLFGYDLPETNHLYLLSHSVNEFWRRASIYWKDFMVKIFYFPAYFGMRRKGDLQAQLLATMLVFTVTWFLHAVQFFWIQGRFHFSVNDTLFWLILGSFVVVEAWIGYGRPKRPPGTGWRFRLRMAIQIVATFSLISILWSMWSANSMAEWFTFLRTGTV